MKSSLQHHIASAPGSLMLLGEYAVLEGYPALVCAINQRMTVGLTPRQDERIAIDAGAYGSHITSISQLESVAPFQFVTRVLMDYRDLLVSGLDLTITSDFSDQLGLGSSAAVTVATLAALQSWLGERVDALALVAQARRIVRSVQGGVGSGADVAASVYGGMVRYQQADPSLKIEKYANLYPLALYYAGFKTKTVDAIHHVSLQAQHYPRLYALLLASIGECADVGANAASTASWETLGVMMTKQQALMEALGVSLPVLRALVDHLNASSEILGAKISGSGLGDCVVGLGTEVLMPAVPNTLCVPVAMTLQGVLCEES